MNCIHFMEKKKFRVGENSPFYDKKMGGRMNKGEIILDIRDVQLFSRVRELCIVLTRCR